MEKNDGIGSSVARDIRARGGIWKEAELCLDDKFFGNKSSLSEILSEILLNHGNIQAFLSGFYEWGSGTNRTDSNLLATLLGIGSMLKPSCFLYE